MPANLRSGLSTAAVDLGLGDMLRTQLTDETDEQRRQRLAAAAAQRALGGTGIGRGAVASLFGGMSGTGY